MVKGNPKRFWIITLNSPQTVYATAKFINTEFIELYFRGLSVSPTVLLRFLAHEPIAEKPRFEKKLKLRLLQHIDACAYIRIEEHVRLY